MLYASAPLILPLKLCAVATLLLISSGVGRGQAVLKRLTARAGISGRRESGDESLESGRRRDA